MADPLRDPRFPERPQTKDFWRLVDIVNRNDAKAMEDRLPLPEIISEVVDSESVQYVARQRALRVQDSFGALAVSTLIAVWLDGFMAGAGFQESGGHQDES